MKNLFVSTMMFLLPSDNHQSTFCMFFFLEPEWHPAGLPPLHRGGGGFSGVKGREAWPERRRLCVSQNFMLCGET